MITTARSAALKAFKENRVLQFCIVAYSVVWIWLAIDPFYRPQWLLENYLVFAFVPFLAFTYKKRRLSDISYVLITIYLILHAFGSHYGYSNVPFGYWLSKFFGATRPNSYDRLVHFLFGFFLAYPLHELLARYTRINRFLVYMLSVDFILSYSAAYELIEAVTAWTLPEKEYDPFVGMQGDIWDGYRDMLLALSGAFITMASVAVKRSLLRQRFEFAKD